MCVKTEKSKWFLDKQVSWLSLMQISSCSPTSRTHAWEKQAAVQNYIQFWSKVQQGRSRGWAAEVTTHWGSVLDHKNHIRNTHAEESTPQTVTEFCEQHPDQTLWLGRNDKHSTQLPSHKLTNGHPQKEDLFNFILIYFIYIYTNLYIYIY